MAEDLSPVGSSFCTAIIIKLSLWQLLLFSGEIVGLPQRRNRCPGQRWKALAGGTSVYSRIFWLQERELLREEQVKWGMNSKEGESSNPNAGKAARPPVVLAHHRAARRTHGAPAGTVWAGQAHPGRGSFPGWGMGCAPRCSVEGPTAGACYGCTPIAQWRERGDGSHCGKVPGAKLSPDRRLGW